MSSLKGRIWPQAAGRLRRFSVVYRGARWLWRRAVEAFWVVLRFVSPRNPRFGPSHGSFTAMELLTSGVVQGRVLEPAHPPPNRPTPLQALTGMGQEQIGSWPVFWTRHAQARLVGRTLIVQDAHKRICYEAAYGSFGLRRDAAFNYVWLPRPVHLEGNWTSVISQWSDGFYHWFMDALPRLGLLSELPADTRILVPTPLAGYQLETLGWLGLQERFRPTAERHLVVENFFFSSPPAMTGCHDPYTVRFLREALLGHADPAYKSPRRFYIKRVGRPRGVNNEQQVTEFFERHGWAVIDTEDLTIAQQIRLFKDAEAICTIHGAALTHLVWCAPGTRVLELVADTFINGVYEGLSGRVGVRHRFLLCQGDHHFRARVDMQALASEFAFLDGKE